MTQGERVKEIRKSLKLTTEQFGEKLGVTKQTVSRIENGVNNLTEQMQKSICREFNVNSEWLSNGRGEMFSSVPETILDALCKQFDLDDFDRGLISEYLKLSPRDRQVLKDYIRNVVVPADETKARIDKEVEEYRRELELEARAAAKLSPRDGISTENGEKMA